MNYNYKERKIRNKIERSTTDFLRVFSDREIKILLLWALVGPFCALAYIVWIKYPRLKWLSVIFFFLNTIYLIGQLGGWLYIIPRTHIMQILF